MVNRQYIKAQTNSSKLSWFRWVKYIGLAAITVASMAMPVKAQKTLYFVFPPFKESLKVESLETFAQDGTVNQDLGFYLKLAKADEQARSKFREALNKQAPVEPLLVARFFKSEIGGAILDLVGNFIQIEGGRNGKLALRGALVTAAFDEEGLSLINFFRQLPTNIQFDLSKMLEFANLTKIAVKATKVFSQEVIPNLSATEAARAKPVDFSNLLDLRQRGSYGVEKKRWLLTDQDRDSRKFYVDIYKPQEWRAGKTPVVIISHGLISKPEDFEEDAKHLASHGYVVALPQHIGSDEQQLQAFLTGKSREIFLVDEFINRPLDISYVIDQLEMVNLEQFEGRLALDRVGVFGHSFGGYTALSVAGATIDFDYLEQECTNLITRINTALRLQCRALNLERKDYNFRDERVVAVLGHNPVNRSIFGPDGLGKIEIPVLIGAGSYDPATPFVFEQLSSFTWLNSSNKYLAMQEGQAHVDVSGIDGGISEVIESVEKLSLPETKLLSDYSNATTLLFFENYVANNEDYLPFIQSSYLEYLSQGQEFKTYLISRASSEQLVEAIEQFIRQEGIE
ncbi:MAG: alpha/beta hydrolase [Xenococcaceae cyanobacterium MO_167.B52]|nr:alpha/beta hydrolase [Xenococcaceae cyanobacterium MO_167.B52]